VGVEMLVLAMFLALGTFFVAFLLRFLFALELDAQIQTGRERRERIYIRRVLFSEPAQNRAKSPSLARSNLIQTCPAWQASPGTTLVDRATSRISKEAS
jgi:hypothetical protein